MTELDTLMHDYVEHRNADVEPLTLDELDHLATGRPLADVEPIDERRPRPRLWLAVAAVVALVALAIGVAALLVGDDDAPIADESGGPSPTTSRLLDLVPADADRAPYLPWIDVAAARDIAGLEPPPTGVSDDEASAHLVALEEVHDGLATAAPWPVGEPFEWWRQIGVQPARLDGWASWGQPPHRYLVAVGPFDPEAIDEAIRGNDWTAHLTVAAHRGVTTYSWGADLETHPREMAAGTFPDLLSLRLAVLDDALLVTRTTDDLHAMIDHALDDASSILDEVLTVDDLRTLSDDARLGGQLWMPSGDWDRGHLDLFGPGDDGIPGRLDPALVLLPADGRSPDDVAARLQPELDRLVGRQTLSWTDDLHVTAEADDELVLVRVTGIGREATVSPDERQVVNVRDAVRATVFPELAVLIGYGAS